MYSEGVTKINQEGKEQDRLLLVTTDQIYNIKSALLQGQQIQRKIPLAMVDGISKTIENLNRTEFVVHVRTQYDYRFKSLRRKEIIDMLKWLYLNKMNTNLPIFEIPQKSLECVTTTEKDKKKGNDKFPNEKFRNRDEDLIKPQPPRAVSHAEGKSAALGMPGEPQQRPATDALAESKPVIAEQKQEPPNEPLSFADSEQIVAPSVSKASGAGGDYHPAMASIYSANAPLLTAGAEPEKTDAGPERPPVFGSAAGDGLLDQ